MHRTPNFLKYSAIFLLGVACAAFFATYPLAGSFRARAKGNPESTQNFHAMQTYAWGDIEAIKLPFGNSDGLFPDRNLRLKPTRWFFEGCTAERLASFFDSCSLRRGEHKALLDQSAWEICSNGCWITPSPQLVWSLEPQSRAKIYSVLGRSETNYCQQNPFRFPLDASRTMFAETELKPRQIGRLMSLTYTNDGMLCFSDLQLIAEEFSQSDFNELIQTICATPSYLLRLRITPETDIPALVNYWGKDERRRFIQPILTSLSRVPGGTTLNVSYLLPPFARLHLYTYPNAWGDGLTNRADCVFTALNFFNNYPDTNFCAKEYREKALNNDYDVVTGDPTFGDLVVMVDQKGVLVHACVYIVEGFVFTKNGINDAQPWVLMRMSEMLGVYQKIERSGRLVLLRRKGRASDLWLSKHPNQSLESKLDRIPMIRSRALPIRREISRARDRVG
jgi:hypothetical protein